MSKHKDVSIPLHLIEGKSTELFSRDKLLENEETLDQELRALGRAPSGIWL